jgi:predicted RNase H-like HicB family nuclease
MRHFRAEVADAPGSQAEVRLTSAPRGYTYTILRDPDEIDGGYTVAVPALPGLVTQGDTFDEAMAMAKDAIALYLEDLVASGEPIPIEHERPRTERLTVRLAV